jgi:DNA-binding PucR family transcriptional regulator
MRALIALVAAIGSGELDAVTRLLADDCVLETDAAGEFHAVVVRVRGARRVAETQLAMARALILRASRIASVNGLPALVLDIVRLRDRAAEAEIWTTRVAALDRLITNFNAGGCQRMDYLNDEPLEVPLMDGKKEEIWLLDFEAEYWVTVPEFGA